MSSEWAASPAHRSWLDAECGRLLGFAAGSAHPEGGFAWLDDQGIADHGRPVELWLTCRMTHVFALGHLLGRPGAGPLADHGLSALLGRFRDEVHGGWYAVAGADEPSAARKSAYEHAFVVLAASSAVAAGRARAGELLEQALVVQEDRFWRDDDGLVVDVWDRAFDELEPYRGVNANMHTVEAYLAAADVAAAPVWRQRALRITERIVHGWARGNGWRIPEHFDESWQPLLDYNRDDPGHPFRPYGATIGHSLEWARLCLHLRSALGNDAPGWLMPAAQALFDAAVRDGWSVDGAEGFVYTVDWDGSPMVRSRLHWVVAEAIAAAAALRQATGDDRYERRYRQWWDYAAAHLLDHDGGSWWHELDADNRPSATVWSGKPDAYHAVQATLVPRLPLVPTLAAALAGGWLDAR